MHCRLRGVNGSALAAAASRISSARILVPHSMMRLMNVLAERAIVCVSRPKSPTSTGNVSTCTFVNGNTTRTNICANIHTTALYSGTTLRNKKSNICKGFTTKTSTSTPTPPL